MGNIKHELLTDALILRIRTGAITTADDLLFITRAAGNESLTILKDAVGAKIGYVVWAHINKYSALKIIHNGTYPKYFYEFCEGNICLILSVFFAEGRSLEARRCLKKFIKQHRVFTYIRNNKAVYLVRQKNSFYKGKRRNFGEHAA